jgi:hypothetical protein
MQPMLYENRCTKDDGIISRQVGGRRSNGRLQRSDVGFNVTRISSPNIRRLATRRQPTIILGNPMTEALYGSRAEQSVAETQHWLKSHGLTAPTIPIDFRNSEINAGASDSATLVLGLPVKRALKHSKAELDTITKAWPVATCSAGGEASRQVLDDLLDRRTSSLFLNMRHLPINAIAFYRPFHLEPFDRWGIYIFVKPLLTYAHSLELRLPFFPNESKELLIHLVLFEIFHHEFYHHLVESAATTLEIVAEAMSSLVPSYLLYRHRSHSKYFGWHEHQPLEEALANAYAYNSLSFISRVKAGYRDALVASYQKCLTSYWQNEGPGYRDAAHYIEGEQVPGNGDLLAMLLGRKPHPALEQVAQSVMPSGFASFVGKPDIPTFLVGSPEECVAFHRLVPAPNETYCHLFWPLNTEKVDEMLKARHQERESAKKAAKAALKSRKLVSSEPAV